MAEVDLSPALIQFIHSALSSYEAAVLLVFVSREPDRAWSVAELVDKMGSGSASTEAARQCVEHLARVGVLRALAEDRFQLVPQPDELRTVVEELREAYDKRPVTLIRIIDIAARAKIQSFADSFKLRRD